MKTILAAMLALALAGCVGDVVRGTVQGAADVGTGAVDVATSPIP